MFPLEKSLYSLYFHELAKIERVALGSLALLLKQEDKLLDSNFSTNLVRAEIKTTGVFE